MTTPYTLPEPACTYADHSYPAFAKAQMHAAYQAGAASRDGEVDALRLAVKLGIGLDVGHTDVSAVFGEAADYISKAFESNPYAATRRAIVLAAAEIGSKPVTREHELSAACWCGPEVDYVDPDTGATVYVHRASQ